MTPFFKNRLQRRLLAHAFTHPDQDFYVRELAELIHEDPGNLSRELKKLEAEGLYVSRIRGNSKFYSLNKSYPLYDEIKKVVFKTHGVAGSLKNLLHGFNDVSLAFLYGSYAKDMENKTSDVDLAVVGSVSHHKLTQAVRDLEKKLNREINFTIYSPEEFQDEKNKKGSFLHTVLKGRIFMLKGDLIDTTAH
ncbi:MAG TPA: nucleotidyltransferase domain-containing protein [Candidatus Omnitrophota bacterium]|nr:nucleotidyltransferase domain-containing protein [Candidatus Omnitrophota bacterium]